MTFVGILSFTAYETSKQSPSSKREGKEDEEEEADNDDEEQQVQSNQEGEEEDEAANGMTHEEDDDDDVEQQSNGGGENDEDNEEEEEVLHSDNDGDGDGEGMSDDKSNMESFQVLFFGIFAILWIVMACLVTFRGPFLVTGNGYFAAWIGSVLCCLTTANLMSDRGRSS